MSIPDYKKAFHRRNDSGELDVFEAAKYFSGYNNDNNNNNNYAFQKANNKEERRGYLKEGRVSLDVPSLKNYYLQQNNYPVVVDIQQQQQQKSKDKKKYKQQPSSPGGKIAQFLNSLFSQTNSKKKKSIKSLSSSTKDEDESPVGRRKRRSSISHFRSTSSAVDARSLYSTSSSGFRTPPPYNLNTPTKSCKDFRSFSDYKDVLATLSKYKIQGNGNNKNNNNSNNGNPKDEKIITIKGSSNNSNNNIDWIDEKLRMVEKSKNYNKYNQEQLDDGADSDSSSDLFELQIDYDFGFCSSGLPVYETTHMDDIKRSSSTAITNGPIKT